MESSYLALYSSGELHRRAKRLQARLKSCDICPRNCRVNRLEDEAGYCHSGHLPVVSSVCAHRGEEPVLSGSRGSGTIFFGNCTMRCVYCQNYQISQNPSEQRKNEVSVSMLAKQMLHLQNDPGCHNINLVSPTHFVPQIVNALLEAVGKGLKIPLVYNTGGYDSLETIRELDGMVDIYLPDLRYASNDYAKRYSGTDDYVERAREVIKEMYHQVGDLAVDENGVAEKGLIVRLLILPNRLGGVQESLRWLSREVSAGVTLSVMSQYYPTHRAHQIPELSGKIMREEYEEVVKLLDELGMENGWVQELTASETYLPDFKREGHPFEPGAGG